MTDIVPAPDVRLSSEFPTNADRVAGVFNTKAANWADTSRTMAADTGATAKSVETNARAAQERAVAADQSAQTATQQADAALGYRNAAALHASTATAKAAEAVLAAAVVEADRERAETAAESAERDAQAVAQALVDSSGGPVVSFNGRGGVVSLQVSDVTGAIPEATVEEMREGLNQGLRLMSPSLIKAAVMKIGGESSPVGTLHVGMQKPEVGTWLETGSVYLQESYPELFAVTGLVTDGAVTVSGAATGSVSGYYRVATAGGNGVMLITGAPNGGSITHGYRSTDGGATWTGITVPAGSWYSGKYSNGLFLLPGVSGAYMTSSNSGVTWVARSFGDTTQRLAIGFAASQWWAASTLGTIKKSSDGITWLPVNIHGAVTTDNVLDIAGFGNVVVILCSSGVWSSNNGGATWMYFELSVGNSLLAQGKSRISVISGNGAAGSYGLFTDDGITWKQCSIGMLAPTNPRISLGTNSAGTSDGFSVLPPGIDANSSKTYKGLWTADGINWGVLNFSPLQVEAIVSDGLNMAIVASNSIYRVNKSGYSNISQFYLPRKGNNSTPFKQWVKAK